MSLKRLASDHASLHKSGLPPYYLFPPSGLSSMPDDLTQLTILLTGPQGTPYSQGLWRLHLRIPEDYPRSPPKASFRTRIWHPNVEESTGAVCVDTLKRDWQPSLTLRDILVTISCLLIHPNPDSALNSAAGSLLQEDYETFARQAKLMTSIHAPIPKDMRDAVLEAKRRGDERGAWIKENEEESFRPTMRKASSSTTTTTSTSSVIMKKPIQDQKLDIRTRTSFQAEHTVTDHQNDADESDNEENNTQTASKENDPSLSPSPVTLPPPTPRKSVLGKRPLSVLAGPEEPEMVLVDDADDSDFDGMTESERNIAANSSNGSSTDNNPKEQRKSPKLTEPSKGVNTSGNQTREHQYRSQSPQSFGHQGFNHHSYHVDEGSSGKDVPVGKENPSSATTANNAAASSKQKLVSTQSHDTTSSSALRSSTSTSSLNKKPSSKPAASTRKVSAPGSSSSSSMKSKARIGVRRL